MKIYNTNNSSSSSRILLRGVFQPRGWMLFSQWQGGQAGRRRKGRKTNRSMNTPHKYSLFYSHSIVTSAPLSSCCCLPMGWSVVRLLGLTWGMSSSIQIEKLILPCSAERLSWKNIRNRRGFSTRATLCNLDADIWGKCVM